MLGFAAANVACSACCWDGFSSAPLRLGLQPRQPQQPLLQKWITSTSCKLQTSAALPAGTQTTQSCGC